MTGHDDVVRRLADRAAIYDILVQYLNGVDTQDWDRVESAFAPGATANFLGRETGPGARVVADFLREMARRHTLASTHHLGGVAIDIDGDRAWVESSILSHHVTMQADDSAKHFTVRGVRYMDDFARTPAGWRIARRTHALDWQYEAEPSLALLYAERLTVSR